MKKALIFGISGQDGSYLAELLLSKGYSVYGVIRRSSTPNTKNIDHLLGESPKITLFYGDVADTASVFSVIEEVCPDEIYNLAAMSHVGTSFKMPITTFDSIGMGTLNILEAIRQHELVIKYYGAMTSELFGGTPPPQNEESKLNPVSPYSCAKLYAYELSKVYREAYGMFICNGILYNHESSRRGENFVTKKIVRSAVRIKMGLQDKIKLGNIDAKRDWGHANDYVKAMYMMMQHSTSDDYIVATGETRTVREFAEIVFNKLGLDFNNCLIIDKNLYRPCEVPVLLGDSTKIRKTLGWKPEIDFNSLVADMVNGVWNEEISNSNKIDRKYI